MVQKWTIIAIACTVLYITYDLVIDQLIDSSWPRVCLNASYNDGYILNTPENLQDCLSK